MPTKIGLHVFHITLYLHELFEPILFFDPHGLYFSNTYFILCFLLCPLLLVRMRQSSGCGLCTFIVVTKSNSTNQTGHVIPKGSGQKVKLEALLLEVKDYFK